MQDRCNTGKSQPIGVVIERFLERNAPHDFNAKHIANELGLKYSSVRTTLSRMADHPSGSIIRTHRGYYRHSIFRKQAGRLFDDVPIHLHSIKVQGKYRNENTWVSFAATAAERHSSKCEWLESSHEWEGRIITIRMRSSRLVEIWLAASDSPLDIEEFCRFCSWLQGRFPLELVGSWFVVQVDINRDRPRTQLSGVKHARLNSFRNAWLTIYQKDREKVRLECNYSPCDITVREVLAILRFEDVDRLRSLGEELSCHWGGWGASPYA